MKTNQPRTAAARRLIYTLIVTTTFAFMPADGWSMLAPAGPSQAQSYDRASDLKTVQTALESKLVRQGLKAHGLTDQEVQDRLGKLSDKQMHQLALRSEGVASGGLVVELLVVVVLVLLIVFLVRRV